MDIATEQKKSAREDALEGIPTRHFSDEHSETLAVYRKIAEHIINYDTFLFHGSVIAVDGIGYLFTAKSGTGKSTHTRFWRQAFGSRAVMINDDKPLLQVRSNGVWAYGTPWNGKHRLGTNTAVPLRSICILERAQENEIASIAPKQALPMLLQQSYRPHSPAAVAKLLALLDTVSSTVDFYHLGCNLDPASAYLSFEKMKPQ